MHFSDMISFYSMFINIQLVDVQSTNSGLHVCSCVCVCVSMCVCASMLCVCVYFVRTVCIGRPPADPHICWAGMGSFPTHNIIIVPHISTAEGSAV